MPLFFSFSLDAIDQATVRMGLQVLPQPDQVHASRVIATPRLLHNVAGLSMPSEKPTDAGLSDPE